MKVDKWITFTSDLLPLVMDGRKTVTRRVIRPQPDYRGGIWTSGIDRIRSTAYFQYMGKRHYCPYGASGTILGVKEGYRIGVGSLANQRLVGQYLVDDEWFNVEATGAEWDLWQARKFPCRATPGRFMYRSLCRTRLLNLDVRVERVQDITEADAMAEGVDPMTWINHPEHEPSYGVMFSALWDSMYAKKGYPWSVDDLPDNWPDGKQLYGNPYVWVTEFERIDNANQTTT